MRIQNSLRNMLFGLFGQMISVISGFAVRTVLIYTLGVEYLGVEGLFSSILLMLSLTNLGFDNAMIYSLYKPLAENNIPKIQSLINLYKNAYRIIGLVVLIIGLSIFPFIDYIIKDPPAIKHIEIIYLLFLMNAVASYYFIYRQSVIIADQRNYIISRIHTVFILLSNLFQILLLLTTHNYILMLSIQIGVKIIENIYIGHKANQLYPSVFKRNNSKLSKKDKESFFSSLYSLFLYKISGVVINGADNIIISFFIGIHAVGIYSNYLLVLATLTTLLSYIFYSITASVGNLVVKETDEKKYFIFRVINFANFWIYGLLTILLWNILNPIIYVWLGEQLTFNKYIVLTILLNFYTTGMQNASTTFREATGLFNKGRYRPLVAAFINVAVSIILVNQIGIAGVIIGTIISRLATYFWFDPYVIYKEVFKKEVKYYFARYLKFLLTVIVTLLFTEYIYSLITLKMITAILVKGALCFVFTNLIFFSLFRKYDEFIYLKLILLQILRKFSTLKVNQKSYNQ
jgi:O-antigen/teichoic acid export membrane protein